MKPRASLQVFQFAGVPVYAHLSLPIGLALISRLQLRPLAWLGLIIVILAHELGHVALLRRYRIPVVRVVLHGFGGECESADWITPWQRTIVAWGGVLAQAGLFAVVALAAELHLVPKALVATDLYFALTGANVLIAAFNLLPFPGLDGSLAWRIVRFGYLRIKHAWLKYRLASLAAIKTGEPSDEGHEERRLH